MVSLVRKLCALNTEDLNLNVFNLITTMSESKILTTYISRNFKWKFDIKKCNLN